MLYFVSISDVLAIAVGKRILWSAGVSSAVFPTGIQSEKPTVSSFMYVILGKWERTTNWSDQKRSWEELSLK